MFNIKLLSLSLFLLITFQTSYSQLSLNSSSVFFQHISLKEGLSQSTVYDIKQDKLGYIWIATADGLNRYDGYRFVTYRHILDDQTSIPSNSISTLLFDKRGDIWIGTNEGLAKYNYNLNTFTTFLPTKNISGLRIFSIEQINNEQFVISTSNGLYNFSEKSGFKLLNFPTMSLGQTAMLKLDNRLLIGADHGLYYYYPKTNKFQLVNKEFEGKRIMCMLHENSNSKKLWFGTEGTGLYLYDFKNNSFKQFFHSKNNPTSISSNYIRSMCYDTQQRLWIGTFVGLNLMNETTTEFTRFYNNYQDNGTISQNSIRSIFSDSQGGLWFGTYYGGLNYYHPLKNQFEHIYYTPSKNTLNDNVVSCMLSEQNGNIWIGTNDKGLDLYNSKTKSFEHFKNEENNPYSISGNNIKALLKDDIGNLYVGTHGGGLNYFNIFSRKFTRISISSNTVTDENVYGLVKDVNGLIWVGTLNGLLVYNSVTKRSIPFSQMVPASQTMNNKILSLLIDSKGTIWIGTDSGVWTYNFATNSFRKVLFATNSTTEKTVHSFFEQRSGKMWIGTDKGLFYFEHNKLIAYKENEDFPNYAICSIQEDEFKRLWISTNRGLISLSTDSEKWRIYTESDGLQSNQFNHYSSCKASDNKLYFGGINGISAFSPEALIDNPYTPPPIINQLTVFNKIVSPNDNTKILERRIEHTTSIELEPTYNVFGLEFVVPNYLAGTKNLYSYTLEGFDKEWYTTDKQSVSYSNLTPGKYIFRVKAANNNGKWSMTDARLEIEILPHWYNTWWAKIIFLALIVAMVIYASRFYLSRQILSKELEFERISNDRIKEIDQAKIRFFVNVSHEFRTPLTLILSPVREMLERGVKEHKWVQQQLNLVERNAERMLHLVNQALDYRKTELGVMPLHVKPIEIISFVKASFDLFTQLAIKKEFDYQFHTQIEEQNAYVDPNYLERILANLLSNAFKYTPKGGTIQLCLEVKDNKVCIEVRDTGSGISKDKFDRIFDRFYQEDDNTQGTGIGLSLVKNLVEKHHGSIELESELGKGSIFKLTLPSGPENYTENELLPKMDPDQILKTNSERVSEIRVDAYQDISDEENNTLPDVTLHPTDIEKKNILLVEDDEEIRNYLASQLSPYYHVFEAENGKIGWEILEQEEDIQLIISDLMMPVLDGLTLCKMVKKNIQHCHIPFILLTAKNEVEHQLKGLQVGADDYIGKPFIFSIIETKIINIFKQHQRVIRKYASTVEINAQELVSTGLDEEFMNRAIAIVEKHMGNEEFSVEDFSSEMCMSRSGLHLKLKAITGESARDFIRKVRLSYACKLLKEGKHNLTEISDMIGFTPAYFSTAFKKYTGYMPSEYVKNIEKT